MEVGLFLSPFIRQMVAQSAKNIKLGNLRQIKVFSWDMTYGRIYTF